MTGVLIQKVDETAEALVQAPVYPEAFSIAQVSHLYEG
jgi:hypothetical protein